MMLDLSRDESTSLVDITDIHGKQPPIGYSIAWSAAVAQPRAAGTVQKTRHRGVAAAMAAREALVADLPSQYGGLAIQAPPPLASRPASAVPTPRVPLPFQALERAWDVILEKIHEDEPTVFCVRYSPDEQLLAAGCGDGTVRLLRADSGSIAGILSTEPEGKFGVRLPMTALRWRPDQGGGKPVILTSDASGIVSRWDARAAELQDSIREEGNQVYALDYRADGVQFATAGKDSAVRVYDDAAWQLVTTLRAGDLGYPGAGLGHSSRVFSLKYIPDEPSMLLSAGWDNTILIWDLRTGLAVGSVFGPHVCGDSLDVKGDVILAGSYRPTKQLQLWDWRTQQLVGTVPYRVGLDADSPSSHDLPPIANKPAVCKIYSAMFSKAIGIDDPNLVAAAGSSATERTGEVRVFARNGDFTPVGRALFPKPVYSLDCTRGCRHMAVCAGGPAVQVLQLPPSGSISQSRGAAVELAFA